MLVYKRQSAGRAWQHLMKTRTGDVSGGDPSSAEINFTWNFEPFP